MSVAERVRAIERASRSGRSTESVAAMRTLGQLAERHFTAIVEAIERHGNCEELQAIEKTLTELENEPRRSHSGT